jgi:hypothetical protein
MNFERGIYEHRKIRKESSIFNAIKKQSPKMNKDERQ